MAGPFKMKGSPMKRNFGIGSPVKDEGDHTHPHPETSEIEVHQESTEKALDVRKKTASSDLFATKYGGTWKKVDGQWKNKSGQTVRERENELASAKVKALKNT